MKMKNKNKDDLETKKDNFWKIEFIFYFLFVLYWLYKNL